MTDQPRFSERIIDEATSWPGVDAVNGSRGELSLRLGQREIGHLHGDHAFHAGFPKAVWQQLYDAGRIDYHPVFPGKPGYGARGDRRRRRRRGRDRDAATELRPRGGSARASGRVVSASRP